MNNFLHILLMQGGGDGSLQPFIMLGLVMIVIYFFMIRPQMKKAKEEKKFRENLKKGDRIVTIGGIHGKILELKEGTAIIETEGKNRLKVERDGISMNSTTQLTEQGK